MDASNASAGAVLQQEVDGVIQSLGFFSRIFSRTELKYAAFDRELTAIVMALKNFRYFVEACEFTIYTDHKPIVNALQSDADRENAWQARHLAHISEYTTDVQHLPGSSNIVADALSCQQVNAIFRHSVQIDWESLAKAQSQDKELVELMNGDHSLKIKHVPVAETSLLLLCDESIPGKFRPLVPAGHRRTIFDNIHNLSHPGIKATTRIVTDRSVWPGLKKNVAFWCRNCIQCQRRKSIVTM